MIGFKPTSKAYRTDEDCNEASIEDVGPVSRVSGIGIFNDGDEGSTRDRVIRILQGFRLGEAIPPVSIIAGHACYPHRYKLTHGVHRLYCSLAAGFTHVPWVEGVDFQKLWRSL